MKYPFPPRHVPADPLLEGEEQEHYVRAAHAAKIVGCSVRTIGRAIVAGELAGRKRGKTWLVERRALRDYLPKKRGRKKGVPQPRRSKKVQFTLR